MARLCELDKVGAQQVAEAAQFPWELISWRELLRVGLAIQQVKPSLAEREQQFVVGPARGSKGMLCLRSRAAQHQVRCSAKQGEALFGRQVANELGEARYAVQLRQQDISGHLRSKLASQLAEPRCLHCGGGLHGL